MLHHQHFLVALVVVSALQPTMNAVAADEGKVSGIVKVGGKPLANGRVLLYVRRSDQFVGAKIRDGAFVIERIPAGEREVTVEGEGVPPKYAIAWTSQLTANVKGGDDQLEWNLDERNYKIIGGKLSDNDIRQIEALASKLTKDPIMNIEIKRPGLVNVTTGVVYGPLDGQGAIF